MNLGRTRTALGTFYRRLAFRVGKARAITATALLVPCIRFRVQAEETSWATTYNGS